MPRGAAQLRHVEGHSKDLDETYWIDNDDSYPRDQLHKSHVYVVYFQRFMRRARDIDPRARDIDPRKFGMRLTELYRNDQIEHRQIYKTGSAEYLIPSAKHPRSENAEAQNSTPGHGLTLVLGSKRR